MSALLAFLCISQNKSSIDEAVQWLRSESTRLIKASRRTMKDGTSAFPPQVGIGYEAFWLRDYAYTLEGSIESYSPQELTSCCTLFVKSLAPDGSGVDCVRFDGTPVYKPGFGTMGENPVADGGPFTVDVAWHTFRKTKDRMLLKKFIDDLVRTMKSVPLNKKNDLVWIDPDKNWDRCPYGFTDTVRKTGDVLFCSLLYCQASRQISDLLLACNRKDQAHEWKKRAERTAIQIRKTFWDPHVGLLRAATVRCREHDIWGSAFAVYLGVANHEQSQTIAQTLRKNYSGIVQHGQIRHLLGGQYWELACAKDEYQNGAFWATPAGWFVYALDIADPRLADQTVLDLVSDFKENGVCEWIRGPKRNLPGYLASISLPIYGIEKMLEKRSKQKSGT